tara:strand:+ start:1378 stop:1527 length:150 start_codon:yes stop_codon:yes gene_type:complete
MSWRDIVAKEQFEKLTQVKCPQCKGKGCKHCDFKGFHEKESRARGAFTR